MKSKIFASTFAALGVIASSSAYAAPVEFNTSIAASSHSEGITIVPEHTSIDATYTVTGNDATGYEGSFTSYAQPASYLVKSTSGDVLPALTVTIHTNAANNLGHANGIPVVTAGDVRWGFAAAYDSVDAYADANGTGTAMHPAAFFVRRSGVEVRARYLPPDGPITMSMNRPDIALSFTPLAGRKPHISVTGAGPLNNNNGPALEMATQAAVPVFSLPDSEGARSLRVGVTAYATVTPVTSVGGLVNGFALSVPGTLTVTPM